MSTRLKRPAFWRHLMITAGLAAFQGYLGYSFFTGQFGFESQDVLEAEIDGTRPLSVTMSEKITALREWARERAVRADD